jgi:hypothetical protein
MSCARTLALLACLALGACGYHTGLTAPEGAKTIGVEYFGNDGPLRDVELQLQTELSNAIARMLPARQVDPGVADLIVRGRVIDYSRRSGIRSPDNELLETGVRITVEATLLDPSVRYGPKGEQLPPRVLRRALTLAESGYRLDEVNGERAARARAMRNLADRLTLDLFGPVAYEPDVDTAQTQEPESY